MKFSKHLTKNNLLKILLALVFLSMPVSKQMVQSPKLEQYSPILRVLNMYDKTVCSAFVVSEHYAITAQHCLDPFQTSIVLSSTNKEQIIVGKILSVDNRTDQALIMGDFSSFKPLKMGMVEGKKNLRSCGYAYGGDLVCFKYKADNNWGFMLKGKGYLYPAMSGGPLVDLKTNTVVGINVAVRENDLIHSSLINFWSKHGF